MICMFIMTIRNCSFLSKFNVLFLPLHIMWLYLQIHNTTNSLNLILFPYYIAFLNLWLSSNQQWSNILNPLEPKVTKYKDKFSSIICSFVKKYIVIFELRVHILVSFFLTVKALKRQYVFEPPQSPHEP